MFKEKDFISLVERSRLGCEIAINQLLTRLQPAIKNYCKKFYRKSQYKFFTEIDELINTINICIFQGIKKLKVVEAFRSWFYRICANRCIEFYRGIKVYDKHYPQQAIDKLKDEKEAEYVTVFDSIGSNKYNPERELEKKQLNIMIGNKVKTIFKDMNQQFKDVFIATQLNYMTYDKYANQTGLKEGTVKSRIFRAMKQVRDEFKKANIYRDDFEMVNIC